MTAARIFALSGTMVLAFVVVGAFFALDANSFWGDELFTGYFANPEQASLDAVLQRSSQDVHPPGYYVGLWAFLKATGLGLLPGARLFSVLCGIGALVALCLAPMRTVGWPARLFAGGVAASSGVWTFYVHEARNYTLSFLFIACMCGVGLRLIGGMRDRGPVDIKSTVLLVGLAIPACTINYYNVMFCGAIFAALIVFARNWFQRLAVTAAGLIVLAFLAAMVSWHLRHVLITSGSWFETDPIFLFAHVITGLRYLVERTQTMVVLAGLFIVVIWAVSSAASGARHRCFEPTQRDRAFLVIVFALTIILGLGVTLTIQPILSGRLIVTLAPVFWLYIAYLAEATVSLLDAPERSRSHARYAAIALGLLLLGAATTAFRHGMIVKQPWRESAEVVEGLPGCSSATLPVAWLDHVYYVEDDPEYFYGFYLPRNTDRRWIKLPFDDLDQAVRSPRMRAFLADAAGKSRKCPILLWSVFPEIWPEAEDMVATLQSLMPANIGARVILQKIRARDGDKEARIFLLETESDNTSN